MILLLLLLLLLLDIVFLIVIVTPTLVKLRGEGRDILKLVSKDNFFIFLFKKIIIIQINFLKLCDQFIPHSIP